MIKLMFVTLVLQIIITMNVLVQLIAVGTLAFTVNGQDCKNPTVVERRMADVSILIL